MGQIYMDDGNLARQAELASQLHGDYDTLFFEGNWYSTGTLADQASRFATGLTQLGVRPGDRLLVLMANCPQVSITYNAAWRAGAAVTPLIFLVSEEELRHALDDSGAIGVITTAEFLPKVLGAVTGPTSVSFVVSVGVPPDLDETPVPVPVHEFAAVAAAEPGTIVPRAGTDLAALLYTGGTTGRSKGVPLSHANLAWCGQATDKTSATADLTTHLIPLPLAHAYGLLVLCIGIFKTAPGRTILMRWFDPAGWVALAEEHRVQGTALVPSMIGMLLTQPLEKHDLSELVAVSSGASPLPAQVRAEFESRVPTATIYEGYGCTESATIISSTPADAPRPGSVGKPVTGCEVTIQDEHGHPLPPGSDGEICVRSPGVMTGYWNSPDLDSTVLAGGWLHTGDIGHLDDDGYLYVVDRKKDLILRGGFNVFPRDVEEVLLGHPDVIQAGVIGRPDPRLGEEVAAFVALRPGATVTADDLIAYARQHLSATKYPRDIRIVPAVPLTSVGKLDRKQLREWLKAELSAGFNVIGGIQPGRRPRPG
jgi:long-chain acyl-CoA synthetase